MPHFAKTYHNFVRTFTKILLKFAAILSEFAATVPELAVTCHKLIKLAGFGRIYLLSVSPRYFYCNWASPVTVSNTKCVFFIYLYNL